MPDINYDGYTIEVKSNKAGEQKVLCPKCKADGKEHWKDTCLGINLTTSLFNCHKCGWTGFFGERATPVREYVKPNIGNLTELSDEHLMYISKRGITQKTAVRNKLKSAKGDWFCFPYYESDEVVNLKYRPTKKKGFMQAKEAKHTMYKYNDIVNQSEIIICEGEFDALSWEEAGYLNATSVNQGAPNANDKNVDKKLECIINCFDIFEQAKTIYISVDSDDNGKRLKEELIKRFTAEKCKIIELPDNCKDANDCLLLHGADKLKECYLNAKEVPVSGIFRAEDFRAQITDAYRYGQPKGSTTHFPEVDPKWTHREGEVTIWTGYNNEGKSLVVKQLFLLKSLYDGWKHAIFSPEEFPQDEWYTDLIESYIGKSADKDQKSFNNYMSPDQLDKGVKFTNKYFFNVFPDDDHSLDAVLKKFSYTVRKYNVKTVTIDPYNQIQHKMLPGEREDLYISRFMSRLKKFAIDHKVGVHLVAHQVTPNVTDGQDYPQPNLYKIKGGGTFGDKADNIISVWRPRRNTDQSDLLVKLISQKIKKQKLTGKPGEVDLYYDVKKNRYNQSNGSPFDWYEPEPIQEEEKELDFNDIHSSFMKEKVSDAPF